LKNTDFRNWLAACKERGLSEWQAAELLGCGRNSITSWKRNGAPQYIGLAIAALEEGLKPWKTK
jgi:transposase